MSAFSSDSRRVAVAWYLDSVNSHELRVVNLDGTGSRVVVPAGEGHYYVDPVDWSRSDEEILVDWSWCRWRTGPGGSTWSLWTTVPGGR